MIVGTERVTVIVPTLAEAARRNSLLRAIDSIRRASEEGVRLLVIVNGDRFDPALVSELRSMPDLEVRQIERGSLPYAIEVARKHVDTPYFCFLDDDDEYLPGAIDLRLRAMQAEPELAVVVTNGYRSAGGKDVLAFPSLTRVQAEPLRTLFERNWLASCGGLFRSDAAGVKCFVDIQPYAEWTWLAFKLAAAGARIGVLETPSFRIFDTVGSASKSEAYRRSFIGLYERMLLSELPRDVRDMVRRRLSGAWHDLADLELRRGALRAAWRCHVKSMLAPHGLRFLPFTRHLVLGALRFSKS